jgi:hypothetical protein
MERYNLDIEVPKEPLHGGQFTFGAVIDQLMRENDVYPNGFYVMIRDMEILHPEIPQPKPFYQLRLAFNKNQDVVIKAGESE